MGKRYLIFALWIALVLIMAACSGDNADNGENADSEEQVFIFARGADSVSLDPAEVTDSESENVAQSILETLVTFEEGETTVAPMLAEEWEEAEDGLAYTFTLKEGVQFHDGTEFNAEAVVSNFERWMNGGADQFPMYGSVFGGYEGDETHIIDSVEAEGEDTVKVTLNQVKPTFLKDLALTPFSISSPAAIEEHGEEYSANPVGTGPFVFDEWLRNDRVVMNKNEDYWLEGYPKLDSVIIRAIPDNSARLNALLSGEVDMIDGVDPDNVEQIENSEDLKVLKRPPLNIGYLGMTVTREPFDDKLVRQALSHAVDKQAMVDGLFAGQAEPAKNPIPPSVEGYNEDVGTYEYDPEKAKELLAEAGYPDGFEMELWAMPVPRPYMPDANKVAEFLQSSFADIGVTANIVTYEWATYLDRAKKGEADAFILGWTGTNGDADDFIYSLWHEDNIGDLNSTQYANEELNQVLEEARTITDQERRNELYREAQEIMHEDPPIIPLVHPTPLLAAKSDITGFDPHPTGRLMTTKIEFE
ncbi:MULTISPECIES: ABC transporter substrate-binding protein [Planococcus]|uniref:ABC transporter substrate-binding protein n=1 Tax=Planococcus maitriensis TaxID=221799 RepID=A0A365K3P1_9BACL|nr:ABC transporter substrate-binding protein [Planococcus maitriensis]RAZ67231.1 ABC transporter substrate-binding protein [Planococcus maitriensis]